MSIFEKAQLLSEQQISFVLITQVDVKGSAPQDLGAKMIVAQNGEQFSTIGGGKIEAHATHVAREILSNTQKQDPKIYHWNLQTDIGMTCGGVVSILFEHFSHKSFPIVIFGAGHCAQALTRVLENLECHVTCIDSREDWTSKLPKKIHAITHPNPSKMVAALNPKSFFISMTMGHAHDMPILVEIAKHFPDCPYVGVIGSEIKGRKIKHELKELGVSDAFLQKLKVPLGLPIGTNHPYEIAISIVAELLQVRDESKRA